MRCATKVLVHGEKYHARIKYDGGHGFFLFRFNGHKRGFAPGMHRACALKFHLLVEKAIVENRGGVVIKKQPSISRTPKLSTSTIEP